MVISKIDGKFDDIKKIFAEKTGLSDKKIDEAILRSYKYTGFADDSRIKEVINKLKRKEKITVCGIGGSITEGALAKSGNNVKELTERLGGEKSYFTRITEFLRDNFPGEVEAVNCGIGATPSFLGALRAKKMAFDKNPDLLTVEFSVNDLTARELFDGEIMAAYESIVTRALKSGAAVMMILLVEGSGKSFAEKHAEIGKFHKIPMISYRDAISPDGKHITDWSNISPDDTHPNNLGHAFLGMLIDNYFVNVSGSDCGEISEYDGKTLYPDIFGNSDLVFAKELEDIGGFTFVRTAEKVSSKWQGALISEKAGNKVSFNIPAGTKKAFVIYSNGNGMINAEFCGEKYSRDTKTNSWPKPMWLRVYEGAPTAGEEKMTVTALTDEKVILLGAAYTY